MVVKKKNGIIAPYNHELVGTGYGGHLCFDCQNAYIGKCKKVTDINKRGIEDYDFILEGYQATDEQGACERLLVMKCDRFVEDERAYRRDKRQGRRY